MLIKDKLNEITDNNHYHVGVRSIELIDCELNSYYVSEWRGKKEYVLLSYKSIIRNGGEFLEVVRVSMTISGRNNGKWKVIASIN